MPEETKTAVTTEAREIALEDVDFGGLTLSLAKSPRTIKGNAKAKNPEHRVDRTVITLVPVLPSVADRVAFVEAVLTQAEAQQPGSSELWVEKVLDRKFRDATEEAMSGEDDFDTDKYFNIVSSVAELGLKTVGAIDDEIQKLSVEFIIPHYQAKVNGTWNQPPFNYPDETSFNVRLAGFLDRLEELQERRAKKQAELDRKHAEKEAKKKSAPATPAAA